MSKPTLLYASPFPPMKSGISDYSVVLVGALEKYFDITLYTDDYDILCEPLKALTVLRYGVDRIHFERFDYRIYNVGNQPFFHSYIYEAALDHPGMIILHDAVLYFLFVGYYQNKNRLYSSTYCKQGLKDFLTIKKAVKRDGVNLLQQNNMPHVLSLNRELIESGNKIMVHSEYARQKILNDGIISPDKVAHINLIRQIDECESVLIDRDTLFSKYNVPTDAIIVSSFGFIDDTKKNVEICRSIKRLSNSIGSKICYVMVGDGTYADNELQSGMIIKTGFTELEEFNSFISYSDIVVNMRYPSMGETSAAMLRILQMGKLCITNNGGWFSEIPDDCVYKINVENVEDELCDAIRSLIEDKDKCKEVGEKAKNYITEYYSAEVISEQIRDFLDGKNL